MSWILGTAGHVDHGKSALLRALTGMEPDRLPEERRRGMTVDLNFVWCDIDSERVGIVDVPGHQRFLKNMVSGTFPLDAFLFVVAADDGWMPQSEEHLQVLRGLRIREGIVIVTKVDLVSAERAEEVARDARGRLAVALGGEFSAVSFSTERPELLVGLREALGVLLRRLPPAKTDGTARLWIDRVFAPKGLGVVVTGTLREGIVREGDEVSLWPCGTTAVVKGLQQYQEKRQEVLPVSRVAMQLSRVALEDVARGMLLSRGPCLVSDCAEARVELSEGVLKKRGSLQLALHLGTARATARLILLEDNFFRLRLTEKLPLRRGDKFILRTAGEEKTLGFGDIVDPHRYRGSHKAAVAALRAWERALVAGESEAAVAYLVARGGIVEGNETALQTVLDDSRRFRRLDGDSYVPISLWQRAEELVLQETKARSGVSEGDLIGRLSESLAMPQRLARTLLFHLSTAGVIRRDTRGFLPPGAPRIDAKEESLRARLREAIASGNGQPVSLREALVRASELKPSLHALVKTGEIVPLGEDHFVPRSSYDTAVAKVRAFLVSHGQAPTTDLKAVLTASRRAAVLLLEQMDRDRVTYLKDGVRRLLR